MLVHRLTVTNVGTCTYKSIADVHFLETGKKIFTITYTTTILVNVENCEGEPEQGNIVSLMSDVKIQIVIVQCKLTRWTPHYLTPH